MALASARQAAWAVAISGYRGFACWVGISVTTAYSGVEKLGDELRSCEELDRHCNNNDSGDSPTVFAPLQLRCGLPFEEQ